jgi:hypothetical protein
MGKRDRGRGKDIERVCVKERERERESVCVRQRERERREYKNIQQEKPKDMNIDKDS